MASIIRTLQQRFGISDSLIQLGLFGFVGTAGAVLNTFILFALTAFAGMHYMLAAAIATQMAIFSNFIGNHVLTFNGAAQNGTSTFNKFVRFQMISLIGLVLTLSLLWAFTSIFGLELLLLWNLLAILITFTVNFTLNKFFTWGTTQLPDPMQLISGSTESRTSRNAANATIATETLSSSEAQLLAHGAAAPRAAETRESTTTPKPMAKRTFAQGQVAGSSALKFALLLLFGVLSALLVVSVAHADVVAISQLGYHPDAEKRVIVYTDATSGTVTINRAGTAVATYPLAPPTDANGQPTSCQGGTACLVADFSDITTPGTYTAATSTSGTSPSFTISTSAYASAAPVLLEFFDAQLQQNSRYHADLNSGYTPPLTIAADGSFIMVADQAALTLMRLGSAYKRNPGMFQTDSTDIIASGTPDMVEHITIYADYLKGLQGVQVQPVASGGFRTSTAITIANAFVPGPTTMTNIDVYTPAASGGTPQLVENVPVVSLCGSLNGTAYDACINHAAQFYKCQEDEPCLNMMYTQQTGAASYDDGNYAVARGWAYEFGCYIDVQLGAEAFIGDYNPCLIFDDSTSREHTVMTLLAYLEALPALNDYSSAKGQEYLVQSTETYSYIKNNYPAFGADADTGYWGAALFLLYDYTQNTQYLQEAYALRSSVNTNFIADSTRGNEFYWEEYIKHKVPITQAGLQYTLNGQEAEAFLWGKLHFDYEVMDPSISSTGERVYQFDNSIQFHNSRFMLTEAVLAAKLAQAYTSPDAFITDIAESQLQWLTGANAVQDGVAAGSDLRSYSFILGIGDHPQEFHSRYLVDTGYTSASSGSVVGIRGSGYQFLSDDAGFVYFDGASSIAGTTLGAFGNGYRGEQNVDPFANIDKQFNNGADIIPGWIVGAFDTNADGDTIFNYHDNIETYQYTETTNEIVATAVELVAYLDAQRNDRPMAEAPFGEFPPLLPAPGTNPPDGTNGTNGTNTTQPPGTTNETNSTGQATLTITSSPTGANVQIDGAPAGSTPLTVSLDVRENPYHVYVYSLEAQGNTTFLTLSESKPYAHAVTLLPSNSTNTTAAKGSLAITSDPGDVYVFLDSIYIGSTNAAGALTYNGTPGQYTLRATKTNFTNYEQQVTISGNSTNAVSFSLAPFNATVDVTSTPPGAYVFVDGALAGTAPLSVSLAPGTHTISAGSGTQASPDTTLTVQANEARSLALNLSQSLEDVTITDSDTTAEDLAMIEGIADDFTLQLSGKGIVEWRVNGVLEDITMGTTATFSWAPSVVYTSQVEVATILATVGNESKEWEVHVEDIINPFFVDQVIGSETVKVQVYTNDLISDFSSMSITMTSASGSRSYPLELIHVADDESIWEQTLTGLSPGNNYISRITGFDEQRGETLTFTLGTERAHYVREPAKTNNNNDDNDRRSARSSSSGPPQPPELVYALFGKDVIGVNETQNLTLDARDDYGVRRAQANILQPNGDLLPVELTLISGSRSYGTWYAEISTTVAGQFTLASVTFEDELREPTEILLEEERGFYVSGSGTASEELGLVYALLNESEVTVNSTVLLRIDARDRFGITNVTASGLNNRGDTIAFPLELVGGDELYGTWEGVFVARTPDSTYSITNITLTNANSTKSYAVSSRSVYVKPLPRSLNSLNGALEQGVLFSQRTIEEFLRRPLVPTVVGFIIMILIVSGVLLKDDIKERFRQYRNA